MKTLELAPAPDIAKKRKSAQFRTAEQTPIVVPVTKENDVATVKQKENGF
jgi:hypothetical protein